MKKVVLISVFIFLASLAHAACSGSSPTWTCSSWADLKNLIETPTATNGDTINFTGTITDANSTIDIGANQYFTILGANNESCGVTTDQGVPTQTKGAGFSTCSTRITGSADPKFKVALSSANPGYFVRISGLEFYYNGGTSVGAEAIILYASVDTGAKSNDRYRMDHLYFDRHGGIAINGNQYGLVDHCIFYDTDGLTSASASGAYKLLQTGCQGTQFGVGSALDNCNASFGDDISYDDIGWTEKKEWEDESFAWNTENWHFFETNIVWMDDCDVNQSDSWQDGGNGGKWVMRYNKFYNAANQGWHGLEDNYERAPTAFIYAYNEWQMVGTDCQARIFANRAGAGVIHDNDIKLKTGETATFEFTNCSIYYLGTLNPYGQCDNSDNKVCMKSLWTCTDDSDCDQSDADDDCLSVDHPAGTPNGYPCLDQTGWVGPQQTQTMVGVVAWDNDYCAASGAVCTPSIQTDIVLNGDAADCIALVKEEREFINEDTCSDSSDNDSDGGTDMADADCIALWDSENGKRKDYTALAYPHPLCGEDETTSKGVSVSMK